MWNFYKELMFFSPFIRIVFITYIYVCIAADYGSIFMHHKFSAHWYGIVAQTYLCAVVTAVWYFFQYTEDDELRHSSVRMQWGSLYQGMKTETFYQMFQTIMFFIRRILFIMALQDDIFANKFGGIMIATMLQICYLIDAKPHEDLGLGFIELFNELSFLFMMYFLPCFTPWIAQTRISDLWFTDEEIKYFSGWGFLACMIPLFVANCTYVILSTMFLILKSRKRAMLAGRIKRMQKMREMADAKLKLHGVDRTEATAEGMIFKRGSLAEKKHKEKMQRELLTKPLAINKN